MNEKDMVIASAKVAGIKGKWDQGTFVLRNPMADQCSSWNPVWDVCDAVFLACKLSMRIYFSLEAVTIYKGEITVQENVGDDGMAALRSAIVQVAVELHEEDKRSRQQRRAAPAHPGEEGKEK